MEHMQMAPDLALSRVALGFWRWKEWGLGIDQLDKLVRDALDLGITTFDHANIYDEGNPETAFGEVLRRDPGLREQMQIITKSTIVYPNENIRVKYYDTSREHTITEVEKSLKRLNTDYIDLFLLHRPDPLMNAEETAEAFSELHAAGKVRHFGVSNYKPIQFDLLQSYLDLPLVTNQVEVSVLAHENFDDGTIAHAQTKRIHPIVWSPLAGGRIFNGTDEASLRVREALEVVRVDLGAETIDEVAFAWLYRHPVGLIPITGSCELEFIKRPIQALQYRLSQEQWFLIWSAATGRKVL
ncbi:aldo/keto reductase [Propionibacteriaceae bacterium Y1923]